VLELNLNLIDRIYHYLLSPIKVETGYLKWRLRRKLMDGGLSTQEIDRMVSAKKDRYKNTITETEALYLLCVERGIDTSKLIPDKQRETFRALMPIGPYSGTPFSFQRDLQSSAIEPPEINESIKLFKIDHPDFSHVGFIMMKFRETDIHKRILDSIKSSLESAGKTGIRSDEKWYHDDLLPNILTYMHGCGFGIAVFERIEEEEFSPNVSLEVGYMMGLRKPVCILKDKNLRTLHADIIGKLYKEFDPNDPEKTIPDDILKWLSDKRTDIETPAPSKVQVQSLPDTKQQLIERQVTTRPSLQAMHQRFSRLVREFREQWIAERDSEPNTLYVAKSILNAASFNIIHFKANEVDAKDTSLNEKLANVIKEMKTLQKHELYADGGKSYDQFWGEGDVILQHLEEILKEISERYLTK
jgi:hypothetical protein